MLIAIRIDVIVVVIDRGDEKSHFIPFVGMPIEAIQFSNVPGARKFSLEKRI